MPSVSQPEMFSLLPQARRPWPQALASMAAEILVGLLIFWFGLLRPVVYQAPEKDYHAIALVEVAPPINHQPQPIRKLTVPPPVVQASQHIPQNLQLPRPVKQMPVPEEKAPVVQAALKQPEIPAPPTTAPRQLVRTNTFSTGSSETPTIAKAPSQVQTGGFGDPNGVPSRDNDRSKAVNIARLGSFDLPAGPGSGNGTAGARGVKGVVASSGFGNGVATGDGSGNVSALRVGVRQSGFGDSAAVTSSDRPKAATVTPRLLPVEIVSKPTPIYTEEARKQKIEGEVLVEVTFEASGRIRVLRVVRSLGFGLDEAAVQAAQRIQFKPAQRDGQATDSTAILHIIFQLA